MPPFQPRRGSLSLHVGWLNLGRETNLPSDEDTRRHQGEKRRRRERRALRGRRAHGRQVR